MIEGNKANEFGGLFFSLILFSVQYQPRVMASNHGNSGYKIKNLRYTSGCSHYRGLEAPRDTDKDCAVNGCKSGPGGTKGLAKRACHVISANQNADSGVRKIVYMCASHNGIYEVHSIRLNAITFELLDCKCGEE